MLQPEKSSQTFNYYLLRLIPLGLALAVVAFAAYRLAGRPSTPLGGSGDGRLHVLSYAGFVASWGPGPEIAKRFKEQTGLDVDFQDGGDAGLLLRKLELFPADVVIGFDQLVLPEARSVRAWRDLSTLEGIPADLEHREKDFVPFDWAPMTFIFRAGEIDPPKNLGDLRKGRFKGGLALEDPRTSTPGLQFLFWIVDEMGVDEGFAFLERLKPNVQSVAASWSAAYGAFTKKEAKLAFSYLTSPAYHWAQEKDETYQPAVFESGHPIQVEYAGIPGSCGNCLGAEKFVRFLLTPEIQKLIMEKNFMFPAVKISYEGTVFEKLPPAKVREWKSLPDLLKRREELFERWRQLGI